MRRFQHSTISFKSLDIDCFPFCLHIDISTSKQTSPTFNPIFTSHFEHRRKRCPHFLMVIPIFTIASTSINTSLLSLSAIMDPLYTCIDVRIYGCVCISFVKTCIVCICVDFVSGYKLLFYLYFVT